MHMSMGHGIRKGAWLRVQAVWACPFRHLTALLTPCTHGMAHLMCSLHGSMHISGQFAETVVDSYCFVKGVVTAMGIWTHDSGGLRRKFF